MNTDASPPAGGDWTAADLPSPALGDLPVEELAEHAVDTTVRTGKATAGFDFITELRRRGDDAEWDGALYFLGLLATRPVYGLPERAGTDRLRQVARTTPDKLTSLVLEMSAFHREGGAQAAYEIWLQAPAELKPVAVLQLLISLCSSVGSDEGSLTAAQTVALIRHAIPTGAAAA